MTDPLGWLLHNSNRRQAHFDILTEFNFEFAENDSVQSVYKIYISEPSNECSMFNKPHLNGDYWISLQPINLNWIV